jgi:hypothetical protein
VACKKGETYCSLKRSLSGGDHQWFKRSTWTQQQQDDDNDNNNNTDETDGTLIELSHMIDN